MDSGENPPVTNLAFFAKRQRTLLAEFIDAAIDHLSPARILVVAAAGKPPASGSNVTTLCRAYSDLAFLDVPISFAQVERQIERWLELEGSAPETILAIDMGWGLETNSAAANFEHWTLVAHRLSSQARHPRGVALQSEPADRRAVAGRVARASGDPDRQRAWPPIRTGCRPTF